MPRQMTLTSVVGVLAKNRDVLIGHAVLRDFFRRRESGEVSRSAPLFHVHLPCGESRSYPTVDDVPSVSERCLCGRVDYPHWFIRYEDD